MTCFSFRVFLQRRFSSGHSPLFFSARVCWMVVFRSRGISCPQVVGYYVYHTHTSKYSDYESNRMIVTITVAILLI